MGALARDWEGSSVASSRSRASERASHQRVRDAIFDLGRIAVVLVVLAAALAAREITQGAGGIDPTGLTADQLKTLAANQLEAATANGGSGYEFEIVQTSTMKAKPGGPRINIPDPENGRVIIGQADEYLAYVLLERGVVRPAGFWSEIRAWPIADEGPPVWEKAELRRSALVRDGVAWRNDRDGWYRSNVVPGIGLDPTTASLLPTLLRDSTGAVEQDSVVIDGDQVLRVDATAKKADIPGVVAADGASFTQLIAPVEFGFDGAGRLVRIRAVALNTNLTEHDLVVDTVITISYEDVNALPQPDPVWVPEEAE
jgi:hypothetical protein